MSALDPPPTAVREIVARALAEDLGILGDVTSLAVIPDDTLGGGAFKARRGGIISGTAAVTEVYRQLDPGVLLTWHVEDGAEVNEGDVLARVEGPLRSILTGERTALNLLGHCSGVASLTRRFVRTVRGRVRIRDTRKTTPGLRALQRSAVRAGGGFNHRDSLSDAVLIKDNHLAGIELEQAVDRARARWPGRIVEIECDTLDQVSRAKAVGVDMILLDNMSPTDVAEAVAFLDGMVYTEVSGGVDLTNVAAYAEAGVDFISIGSLTHSAPTLDVALDLE